MAFLCQSTYPILEIKNVLIVPTDGLEVGQIVGHMLLQRGLQSGAVPRQNTYRFELLFSHDLFQPLAGHPLVRGVQRNIGKLVFFIEAVSAAVAIKFIGLVGLFIACLGVF